VTAAPPVTPESLIRPEIRELSAYRVADGRGLIKLDAMENPYPWPGPLTDGWLECLRGAELNRYPDAGSSALKERLKTSMPVPPGAALLLGNGSDEIIQILIAAVAAPGAVVLSVEPTFVMYRTIARFLGVEYVGVPLDTDFRIDSEATLDVIRRRRPRLVFLAYPNNPTGNLFEADAVRGIIRASPGLVVVDEAYFAFADHSFLPEVLDHPNLLLMRTVSKIGLAGLRLGFLAGAGVWLNELEKLRLPYNINTLTQLSTEFALRHKDELDRHARRIRAARSDLGGALSELPGLTVFPSDANFILFRVAGGRGPGVFEGLREQGVLVKNLSGAGSALRDCLRVTVGSEEQNVRFLEALRRLLG
jgi:histidinol-phosphate aminotransferase